MEMLPVVDLHCDLLSYLATVPGAGVHKADEIGASVPHLRAGYVKLQVMAIYTDTKPGSAMAGEQQRQLYHLLSSFSDGFFEPLNDLAVTPEALEAHPGCYTLLALENASSFSEEDEALGLSLKRFDALIEQSGPLAYVIMTHHYENRFGGGNYTSVGLKPDGEVLLDFLHNRCIPVDLAHTSDKLAYGILNYIDKRNLNIPVLASHSNFRQVHGHVRNLPEELALELVRRNGIIGINLLRNYIHETDPRVLYDHIDYGLKLGAGHLLALGADFFYALHHPDPSRYPIYFPGQDNASNYQAIMKDVSQLAGPSFCTDFAYGNALSYFARHAKESKQTTASV